VVREVVLIVVWTVALCLIASLVVAATKAKPGYLGCYESNGRTALVQAAQKFQEETGGTSSVLRLNNCPMGGMATIVVSYPGLDGPGVLARVRAARFCLYDNACQYDNVRLNIRTFAERAYVQLRSSPPA
jgi:hypothetical protein